MGEGQSILTELRDDVIAITLNQPEKLNSLSPEMLEAIPRALAEGVTDGARAALITGNGRAFCTGAQMGADGMGEDDLGVLIDEFYNPMAKALADSPIPIVTAINGPAAGAGASLALAGDIILAARSSYLLLAFSNIGLVPDAGATWLVAKAVGRVKALEMALLGERLRAEDALAAGLVTRVLDDEGFVDAAWGVAKTLASRPTMALGLIRKQIAHALSSDLESSLAVERANQSAAGFSDDFAEGMSAFRAKRAAVFIGR